MGTGASGAGASLSSSSATSGCCHNCGGFSSRPSDIKDGHAPEDWPGSSTWAGSQANEEEEEPDPNLPVPPTCLRTVAEAPPTRSRESESQQSDAAGPLCRERADTWPQDKNAITDSMIALAEDSGQVNKDGERSITEFEDLITESKTRMQLQISSMDQTHNRYSGRGDGAVLPAFQPGRHVPVLALINPSSGAMAGGDILRSAQGMEYYAKRFFNIIDVVKDQRRGGLLDVFRIELNAAKNEAKQMRTRPRLISGGGDGTGSFALHIVFLALRANSLRAEEGLQDTGNGFIWDDEELGAYFPALAQMPLGSANDFANILGWGQKYPGYVGSCACGSKARSRGQQLARWVEAVLDPKSRLANFDVWGIFPDRNADTVNFKVAELAGKRGWCPNKVTEQNKRELHLKLARQPVPFFVCLYFSVGFGAYMVARFQINRRSTPLMNRIEYIRQAIGILREPTPPQMRVRLTDVEVDCEEQPYFPPRRHTGNSGKRYREVGFYNINWQAHALHGADRDKCCSRISCKRRDPVKFDDGKLDMFRWNAKSFIKNPGPVMQTDKKKDMMLTFRGDKGHGLFFQWDGEARFAFSPEGKPFSVCIKKALTIPVVLGPKCSQKLVGDLQPEDTVQFRFGGETSDDVEFVRKRILRNAQNELPDELIATQEEVESANLRMSAAFSADNPNAREERKEPS